MDVLAVPDREGYIETQIARSNQKFEYCKVSVEDVRKYRRLLAASGREPSALGPICCLGTRNGREVDLFRSEFFANALRRALVRLLERRTHSFVSRAPVLEAVGRSDARHLTATSVVGVEINPRLRRRDVWVGSFDAMPEAWSGRFGLIYSNSFDQSQDPLRTAQEWRRIVRPGGFMVLCYTKDREPTATDPVGRIEAKDLKELFGGQLVHVNDKGSQKGYAEAILRMPESV